MNILKEWERDPPDGPMDSLTRLWLDFKSRRRDPASPICRFRDNIPDLCAEQKDGREALRIAVRSIRPNGKMHNHQSKVSKSLPEFERTLIHNYAWLRSALNFTTLHHLVKDSAQRGIGPMTVYDVSVRFGAWLGVNPKNIYVHAGTSAGLKALGINPGSREVIMMNELPYPIKHKDPDTVEDFLCTYRMAFELL